MTRISRPWRPQNRFLRELAKTCCVASACRASGLARRIVYRWRATGADFRRRWDSAIGRGTVRLRDEAMQRALLGENRPVWHDGRVVGEVRVADNRTLWRLLQHQQPETYGRQARELREKRERDEARLRELEAAERRVAAYDAERRAEAARTRISSGERPECEAGSGGDPVAGSRT